MIKSSTYLTAASYLFSVTSFISFAQSRDIGTGEESDSKTTPLEYALYGSTSMFATTYLHESAHFYTAKHYGASDAKMHVNILGLGGQTEFKDPDQKISNHQNQIITISGVTANRAMAGASNQLLNVSEATGVPAKWGAMFYFTNRAELLSQWVLGIVSWTDFSQQANLVSTEYNQRAKIMGLWGAALSLDLYLCWNDVVRNYARLTTGSVAIKPIEPQSGFMIYPSPISPMVAYRVYW